MIPGARYTATYVTHRDVQTVVSVISTFSAVGECVLVVLVELCHFKVASILALCSVGCCLVELTGIGSMWECYKFKKGSLNKKSNSKLRR